MSLINLRCGPILKACVLCLYSNVQESKVINCNRLSATIFLYHSVYLTRQIILLVLGGLLMNDYLVHRLKQYKKLPSFLVMTLRFNF